MLELNPDFYELAKQSFYKDSFWKLGRNTSYCKINNNYDALNDKDNTLNDS
jgi:hypothetical protein